MELLKRLSLSSWRAWIEIGLLGVLLGNVWSLSSWRAWIEMKQERRCRTQTARRSPHGERGLKYSKYGEFFVSGGSLSSWRAWIEIPTTGTDRAAETSLSSWRAWIEIVKPCDLPQYRIGRSPHGERGLKLLIMTNQRKHDIVALLMESVD